MWGPWTALAIGVIPGRGLPIPEASILAGPLYDEEGILHADLEPDSLWQERQRFDPAGHYHRPDVLQLRVRPLRRRGERAREG